jgi:hypothetical protein
MAVQGHPLDAELLPELAHAERLDAIPIRQLDGSLKHALPGEGRATLGEDRFRCHGLTSLHCIDMFTA